MFEPMDTTVQQQRSLEPPSQILDKIDLYPEFQSITSTQPNSNSNNEFTIHNDFINIFDDKLFKESLDKSEPPERMLNLDDIMDLQDQYQLQMTPQQNLRSMNHDQLGLLIERKTIDNAILKQAILQEKNQIKTTLQSNKTKVHQNQSTTVGPLAYISDSSQCTPCTRVQIQNDYAYQQQQLFQYDPMKSQKIRIKCHPRSKFRPRTQNESKTSSHYIRCEDGAELDYPAIDTPQIWAHQSDVNIIEVALMGIDKEAHLYSIMNKTQSDTFEDGALIFKQDESHILYFRLTNEDFLRGYATFMIEFIKSKQDDVITKNLIRQRKLNQSMLRFTRIHRDEHGKYQRDADSEEYSSVMTENYGEIAVERVDPRYGPMDGQQMLFIVLKGRISKGDVSIIISEQGGRWSQEIEKFTLNGTIVYFPMPACSYSQTNRVIANVNIYHKKQLLHQSTYLYTNSCDEEFAEVNRSHLNSPLVAPEVSNNFNQSILTDLYPTPITSQKV